MIRNLFNHAQQLWRGIQKRVSYLLFTLLWIMSIPSLGTTCPDVGTIISSDPNSEGRVTYMSPSGPGWHSDIMPPMLLSETKFQLVYASTFGMNCTYLTNNGYLFMFPNNRLKINIADVFKHHLWQCSIAPDSRRPVDSVYTEQVCVCNDFIQNCAFVLQ